MTTPPPLFALLTLRDVTLANRLVIAPTQHCPAGENGLPNAFHRQHS